MTLSWKTSPEGRHLNPEAKVGWVPLGGRLFLVCGVGGLLSLRSVYCENAPDL